MPKRGDIVSDRKNKLKEINRNGIRYIIGYSKDFNNNKKVFLLEIHRHFSTIFKLSDIGEGSLTRNSNGTINLHLKNQPENSRPCMYVRL